MQNNRSIHRNNFCMLPRKNDMKVQESPQASKVDNFLGTITNV